MFLRGFRIRFRLGVFFRMEGRVKINGGKLAFVGSGGGIGCFGFVFRGVFNI